MLSHDFCCEIKVCAKIYVWNACDYSFCDLIGPYGISVTAGICMSPDGQRYSLLCCTVKSLPPAFRNQLTHNYNPIYLITVTTPWCISNWNNCQCMVVYWGIYGCFMGVYWLPGFYGPIGACACSGYLLTLGAIQSTSNLKFENLYVYMYRNHNFFIKIL